MLVSWVVIAPILALLARHKWIATAVTKSDVWFTIHQWGAFGVCLMSGVALLLAILDFHVCSEMLAHTVQIAQTAHRQSGASSAVTSILQGIDACTPFSARRCLDSLS